MSKRPVSASFRIVFALLSNSVRSDKFRVPLHLAVLGLAIAGSSFAQTAGDWSPVEGQLLTRWAQQVSPETPLPEYPRPQLQRESWVNLNGLWDYSITDRSALDAGEAQGRILVPFAIESALSGVKKAVSPEQALWYERSFEVPSDWDGQRVMLNFGAVDWEAAVFVNGVRVGEHRGGYTPFSFDITEALRGQGSQELKLRVWDPTDTGTQARGKQVLEPEGIWYTAVTGIWQTVWIEPVSEISISRIRAVPDIDNERFTLHTDLTGSAEGLQVNVTVRDGSNEVGSEQGPAGEPLDVSIPNPKLWSPDSPNLYDMTVALVRGGETVDEAESYVGMRKIEMARDDRGDLRFFLNNEPLFHLGPLDQGWWPDGLYTAPTDEALLYDVEVTRKLGFNTARKHVKVEPARWYYHCDKVGLLVWQDMPSAYLGGRGPGSLFVGPWDEEDAPREGVSEAQFEAELKEMIDSFAHFPSIVMWVPFNEGWGQYDTARIAEWVGEYDPSRLVNAASGWTDRPGTGDMYDTHLYPGPGMQLGGPERAAILGEFGGLGWPVTDHLWWDKRNWGYRTYQSQKELVVNYRNVFHNLIGPWSRGVAAAIYTQTTDVEGEVNGLMTYDRDVIKLPPATAGMIEEFYGQPPKPSVVAPSAMTETQSWMYRVDKPSDDWNSTTAGNTGWEKGTAPFRSRPDSVFPNGTKWADGPIWIRRTFAVDELPENLWLEVQTNSTKGTIYLNGTRVADLPGGTRREYHHEDVSHALSALKVGENILAVEAQPDTRRPDRPHDLDVGLYAIE